MKKLLLIVSFLIYYSATGQTLSLFTIDTSKFTTLRAKFFAFDKEGKQILDLSPEDFDLTENGTEREVTYISCPTPKPPQPISSVLTIDISGSMGGDRLDMAKEAAVAWVDALPTEKSDCAVTSFTTVNMLHTDFTNDKQRLRDAILSLHATGGTDFNAGFINPMAGALLTAEKGKNKRVVVFLTDGQAQGNEDGIVQKANEIGAIVYCVVLGTYCPAILRNISERTGGMWFENVVTGEQAKEIYLKILTISQSLEACTIEWLSKEDCNIIRNVVLTFKQYSSTADALYTAPMFKIAQIEYSPSPSIKFGIIDPPYNETKSITLTARNKGVSINSISLSNPQEYEIVDWDGNPPPFTLTKDIGRVLKVKYTPKSTGYSFCRFDLDYDACFGNTFFATGGNFDTDNQSGTLKLTFPDGGETFVAGADSVITWEGILPEDTVRLDYSTNNGDSWTNISNKASDLKYDWKGIANTPSNKCLMRVKQENIAEYYAGDLIKLLGFGSMNDVAYSPNSNRIAIANNNQVNLINLKNNAIIRTFSVINDKVLSVAYSPDGGKVVCGTQGGNVYCWDVFTGQKFVSFNSYAGNIKTISYSPDGNWLLTAGSALNIWNANTGLKVRNFSGFSGWINSASFSSDGNKIVSGGYDKIVHIWDVVTGAESQTFTSSSTGAVNAVALSPDGSRVASAGENGIIYLWQTKTGNLLYEFIGHKNGVNDIIFTSDGNKLISCGSDGNIKIWQVKYGTEYMNLFEDNYPIRALSLSPNGRKLASASSEVMRVWDLDSGKVVSKVTGHRDEVRTVALSPDNRIIASGGNDNTIILWDIQTGTSIKTLKGHTSWIMSLAFNSDGSKLVSGGNDFDVKLWDVQTGKEIRSYRLFGHVAAVYGVDFSPFGDKIVSGSIDNTIKIWDANSSTLLKDITDINSGVYTVAFNPDGTMIASSGSEQIIRLWDAKTGAELKKLTGHSGSIYSVCFSPDGKKIASGSIDKTIQIWNIDTGESQMTLKGHQLGVSSVIFNSEGTKLISGSFDKSIKVWDLLAGSEIMTFNGHSDFVNSVDISADGGKVISGSSDWTVGIWAVMDQTEDIGMEDESDSVWSIVAPATSSFDIDMGKVLTATMKDSLVTEFVKNTGTYKFRIDTVFIAGQDASAFSVVSGMENYLAEPGKAYEAGFRFSPVEARIYEADILIVTQSDTLKQKIRGEGVEPNIRIVSDLIDFGKVYLNYYKDTTVSAVIENIGSNIVNISNVENAGPDKKQFSILKGGGSFTLSPGDKHEMELRFSALELGRTSGSIAFHHGNVGSPAIVQLFAESYKIIPNITTNSPICIGHDLCLYTNSIPEVKYHWSGPNGFESNDRNIIIKKAGMEHAGNYRLYVTLKDVILSPSKDIFSDTSHAYVEINIDKVSPGDSSLIYVGNAERVDNYLKLTDSRPWIAGSVWLKNRFSVLQDFTTTFEFNIKYGDNRQTAELSLPGADGFAFVMQNHNYPVLGNKGEAMGYDGITNSMAIEFDLFRNTYDPNGNHIAVQSLGARPNTPDHRIFLSVLGINDDIPVIRQDILYYVKINYKHSGGELSIYLDTTGLFSDPVLTIPDIDLAEHLNLENEEYVYIGFTGATGQACQEQRIYNWKVPCDNQYVGVEDDGRQTADGRQETILNIYPNPASDILNIEYSLNSPEYVILELYDILGNKIETFDYGFVSSGRHYEQIDLKNKPMGMYYLILKTNDKVLNGKFGVMR